MDSVLNLLVIAALTPVAYNFPVDAKRSYDLQANFDGYIQVLGGHQATVQVNMAIDVQGLAPDELKRPRVASELTDVKLLYNGAPMNMELKNVQAYFPRTTISIDPQGKVLKTDAPDVVLPVRLPGLDARRFPDVTYLPVEFPVAGIEVGKSWTFEKNIGGSEATYTVTPTKIGDDKIELSMQISQTYESYEDVHKNPVEADKQPTSKIVTTLSGKGGATFDRALGVVSLFTGEIQANGVVTDLKTQQTSERKLHTTIKVALKAKT